MAISYIDTNEVENISKEILSLSIEFNSEINKLFSRFSEVSAISKEWVGQQSEFYFDRIAKDKKNYNDFAESLKNISYKISKDIHDINVCISKNINQE